MSILKNQQKYDQSLDFHRRATRIYEEYYLSDHANVAISLNKTADILYRLENYDEALQLCEQALTIQERLYGINGDVKIVGTLTQIGNILFDQEKYDEALHFYQRSLMINENLGLSTSVSTAVILNDIGRVFHTQEKYS